MMLIGVFRDLLPGLAVVRPRIVGRLLPPFVSLCDNLWAVRAVRQQKE